jgi:cytochrome c oxidase subunit 1
MEISHPIEAAARVRPRSPSYLTHATTVWSWLSTKDHKRIGIMFLVASATALFLGGVFALLLRIELLTPRQTMMEAITYSQMFTLHGVIMVWGFMIPAIPSGFGNFVLPIMLGAKDVAFPRLNLLSFYLYFFGIGLALVGMVAGGADTGWTFYVPYSSMSPSAVAPIGIGIFIVGFSSIVSGLNFIVTTHTMRMKGLGWFQMPLFVWALYATSIIQVLATPVLGLTLLLVFVDHTFQMGIFNPALGGDPVLFQHLFWFYSHPAVYIMVLPAMGVISETISSMAHKNPASYDAIAYSSLGIAFVGFLGWGHHMFTAGMSAFDAGAFGVLSMLVAIFSAIKVFAWVSTLYRGSIAFTTPMAYVFAFLFLFTFGGMTGVAVASMGLDIHWHDTYFIVAHFHFIMVGATMTGFLAGLHYWWPKMTGRLYSERWGLVGAALVFLGFFVTFFPQFLLGNAGMPRRYYDYPERYQTLHVVSTTGSWLLGLGLVVTVIYLSRSLTHGPRAGDNPWGSRSFEWRTASPPVAHNFSAIPVFEPGAYDYHLPIVAEERDG